MRASRAAPHVSLFALAGVLTATAIFAPSRFDAWSQEDAFVEWATVMAYLGAAAALLGAQWRVRREPANVAGRHWAARLLLAGTVVFCLFVAGEEISWGQRLFAFEPPEVFLAKNYQQEMNVHNFLKGKSVGGFKLDSRYLVALVAMAYGLLAPALSRMRGVSGTKLGEVLRVSSPKLVWVPWFFAVAAVEWWYPVDLVGEVAELFLGLSFLGDAMSRAAGESPRSGWAGSAALAGAVALGLPAQAAFDALLYGPDELGVQTARAELALLGEDVRVGATPKLFGKGRVHKRVFTAVLDEYVRFGMQGTFLEGRATPAEAGSTEVRRDRRGYFLDPWHNPYWLEYESNTGIVRVYSFGPNRRRDSELESGAASTALIGDDLGVEVRRP